MPKSFRKLFPNKKSIIGMIHLAGDCRSEKLKRALDELTVYVEEGVHGAIVEDYHGDLEDIEAFLKQRPTLIGFTLGVNYLRNPYAGFKLAEDNGASFVQFDSVLANRLNHPRYDLQRIEYPEIAVLGGVRFKYQQPTGRSLEDDVHEGIRRSEAVVTTGDGTAIETPIEKLRDFRKVMGAYPLIVGAGVTAENVRQQLNICEGAIVGSYFKEGCTENPVIRGRVRELMSIVKELN